MLKIPGLDGIFWCSKEIERKELEAKVKKHLEELVPEKDPVLKILKHLQNKNGTSVRG